MAHFALKKLKKDYQELLLEVHKELFKINPTDPDNLFHWTGLIYGPKDTPYENGEFIIDVAISHTYPNSPPSIKFITDIYHPNISESGEVCLNILRAPPMGDWRPSLSIEKTILSLYNLLSNPNASDSLNMAAGQLFKNNYEEFKKLARHVSSKAYKKAEK